MYTWLLSNQVHLTFNTVNHFNLFNAWVLLQLLVWLLFVCQAHMHATQCNPASAPSLFILQLIVQKTPLIHLPTWLACKPRSDLNPSSASPVYIWEMDLVINVVTDVVTVQYDCSSMSDDYKVRHFFCLVSVALNDYVEHFEDRWCHYAKWQKRSCEILLQFKCCKSCHL